jgi:hypothetical protein
MKNVLSVPRCLRGEFENCAAPLALATFLHLSQRFRAGLTNTASTALARLDLGPLEPFEAGEFMDGDEWVRKILSG